MPENPAHPRTEIARALRLAGNVIWPYTAFPPLTVGCYREYRLPPWITREPPQKPLHLMAKPPCRRDMANIPAKPGFDPAGARLLDHDVKLPVDPLSAFPHPRQNSFQEYDGRSP